MKIQIKSGTSRLNFRLPTCLVFGKVTVRLANSIGRRYAADAMKDIPPEALEAIFAEFSRIKRVHGKWELVDIQSSNGDIVNVIL